MTDGRVIKVFIGSPGDLATERRAFKDVIEELNAGFAKGANVRFEPLGWEDALSQVGRRSQSVINQDVDACDVFVLVIWRRWGQKAPDATPYSSYTEEEYYRALSRYEKTGAPSIFVFFKHIDPGQVGDPGPQLKRVLAFRTTLEATRRVLHRSFATEDDFKIEIRRHLVAYAGHGKQLSNELLTSVVPDAVRVESTAQKSDTQRAVEANAHPHQTGHVVAETSDRVSANGPQTAPPITAAEASAHAEGLALAENAARAAMAGRIEEARHNFAKTVDSAPNLRVLALASQFFIRIGELDRGDELLRRSLAISGVDTDSTAIADVHMALADLQGFRGDVTACERSFRRALEMYERNGHNSGITAALAGIGALLTTRDDLDGADHVLGRAHTNLGFADSLAQCRLLDALAALRIKREDLAGAEAMQREALHIAEQSELLDDVTHHCSTLGSTLARQGDYESAELIARRGLEISERLGRRQGVASANLTLGDVFLRQETLNKAAYCYEQAALIFEKLGGLRHLARCYLSLGRVRYAQPGCAGAEDPLLKAIALYATLNNPRQLAHAHHLHGRIKLSNYDFKRADIAFDQALAIYMKLDHWVGISGVYGSLAAGREWLRDDIAAKVFRRLQNEAAEKHRTRLDQRAS